MQPSSKNMILVFQDSHLLKVNSHEHLLTVSRVVASFVDPSAPVVWVSGYESTGRHSGFNSLVANHEDQEW